jgi:hypothetical protein
MTTQRVIAQERAYVDEMITLLGLDLGESPIKQEPPRPDYWFRLGSGRRIAVEVTRAIDQDVQAGNAGARQRLKKLIKDELVAQNIAAFVYLSIPIGIASALEEEPGTVKANATAIVQLAREVIESGVGPDETRHFEDIDPDDESERFFVRSHRRKKNIAGDLSSRGIKYIDWIQISRSDEALVGSGGGGMGYGPSLIQGAIDAKREKYDGYDVSNADEFWLLVVGSTGSGSALDVRVTENRTFSSPFAKTVFLELFEGKCVALAT